MRPIILFSLSANNGKNIKRGKYLKVIAKAKKKQNFNNLF
jgi:hypothetical protein